MLRAVKHPAPANSAELQANLGEVSSGETSAAPGELVFERVTDTPVPASGSPTSGKTYSWLDTKAEEGAEYVYRIELLGRNGQNVVMTTPEISPDPTGRPTSLNVGTGEISVATISEPLDVIPLQARTGETFSFAQGKDGMVGVTAFSSLPSSTRMLSPGSFRKKLKAPASASKGSIKPPIVVEEALRSVVLPAAAKVPDKPRVKFSINQAGIYRVTGQALVEAGIALSDLSPKRLKLTDALGQDAPIRLIGLEDGSFDADDSLEFWAEPIVNRYYAANAYWLAYDAKEGSCMAELTPRSGSAFEAASYPYQARLEGDDAYYAEPQQHAHWFFDTELMSPGSFEATVPVDHLVAAGQGKLRVGIQGLSGIAFGDPSHKRHKVALFVNGSPVGEYEWEGDTHVVLEYPLEASTLAEGNNTVIIEAPDEDGALEQFLLVDFIYLTYPRALAASEEGLVFESSAKPGRVRYTISDFPAPTGLVYGVRAGGTVVDYYGELAANGGQLSLLGRASREDSEPAKYVAIPQGSIRTPELKYVQPSTLKEGKIASYLIVAPAALHDALKDFAAHRKGLVVDLQDVYDAFGGGLPDPAALRAFLVSAASRGAKMALLVGDGHYDYRDFQNSGVAQAILPMMVSAPFGETASDAWFALPEGASTPVMAVGRWPVNTAPEVAVLIDKTLVYEGQSSRRQSLLIADDESIFRSVQDRMAERLEPLAPVRLNYGEYDAAMLREELFSEFNQGLGLLSYVGHGGVQLLSSAQLLKNEDVSLLNNAGSYPVMLVLGCLAGYYAHPVGLDSLAEVLLREPEKGIVATLSPSGQTSTVEQELLGGYWIERLREGDTLGQALLAAQRYVHANTVPEKARDVILTFNLLGDPALKLKLE